MTRYGEKTKQKIRKFLHEYKHSRLASGKSRKRVESRKQAIAIALSEAREGGAKIPSITLHKGKHY